MQHVAKKNTICIMVHEPGEKNNIYTKLCNCLDPCVNFDINLTVPDQTADDDLHIVNACKLVWHEKLPSLAKTK